jgi:2-polyprenyl-3-methyl-5-hydroxy-6-metoxy-1,4-benzoquinol methylase
MSKQAEREYALRVEQGHLYTKPYTQPRALREFGIVLELLRRYAPEGSVLDLGCGPGWTSLFLARAGYDVTGIDISERMIEIAQQRAAREGVPARFLVADMEELSLEEREHDAALCFDSLHHCPGYERVLRRVWEHLRPGGWLLLMEPSWLHHVSPHARRFARAYGVTELGFTRGGLERSLRRAGFSCVRHHHDAGPPFRGPLGFLLALARVTLAYVTAYPQVKQIVLARK